MSSGLSCLQLFKNRIVYIIYEGMSRFLTYLHLVFILISTLFVIESLLKRYKIKMEKYKGLMKKNCIFAPPSEKSPLVDGAPAVR